MASSSSSPQKSKDSDEDDHAGTSGEPDQDKLECAVCLQTCVQPVQLPCMHIFCYLCVKGVTHQSKRCAMCRQEIPSNYLDNPHLISVEQSNVVFEGSYQWFYEGKNGWWQYDERTSTEIEAAYKAGDKQCEVLIAGFLYVIDFENNVQYRRCDPFRRRKIKRDLISAPKKGVAGIRLPSQTPPCDDATSSLQSLHLSDSSNGDDACCSKNSTSDVSGDGDGIGSVCSPKRGRRGTRARGRRNRKNATRAASPPSASQQQSVAAVSGSSTGSPSGARTPGPEARVGRQPVKTSTGTAFAAAAASPSNAGQEQPTASKAAVAPSSSACVVAAPAPRVCMVYQPVISTTAGLAVTSIATPAGLPTVLPSIGRPVATSVVPVSAASIICLPSTVYQVAKPIIVKIAVGNAASSGLAVPSGSTGGVRSLVLTKPQVPETKPLIPADNQSKPQETTAASDSSSAKVPVPEVKREFCLRKRRSTPKMEPGPPRKRARKTGKGQIEETEVSNP